MKLLKYLLLLLLFLLLVYLILCAVGPKNGNMSSSIEITAPPSFAFNLVNDFNEWESWNNWQKQDSSVQVKVGATSVGVNANLSVTGAHRPSSSFEVIESEKNKSIVIRSDSDGWEGYSKEDWFFEKLENSTKITKNVRSVSRFPFLIRAYLLVTRFQNKRLSILEMELQNVKRLSEQRKIGSYSGYVIKSVQMPEKNYILSRSQVPYKYLQQYYTQNLGSMFAKVLPTGVEIMGMPSVLFFRMDEASQKADVATAIPVKELVTIKGTTSLMIPTKRAVMVDYYGDYNGIGAAHEAIKEYLSDRGMLSDMPIIEEHVTDTSMEQDPSKWLTKVTYYLADEAQ